MVSITCSLEEAKTRPFTLLVLKPLVWHIKSIWYLNLGLTHYYQINVLISLLVGGCLINNRFTCLQDKKISTRDFMTLVFLKIYLQFTNVFEKSTLPLFQYKCQRKISKLTLIVKLHCNIKLCYIFTTLSTNYKKKCVKCERFV